MLAPNRDRASAALAPAWRGGKPRPPFPPGFVRFARGPELALYRREERGAVEELARLHHETDLVRVADVCERIAGNDEQIGELAALDRAELGGHVECARAVDRRHPDRRRRWNAGGDERLQFAVRSEARQKLAPARMIGADRNQPPAAGVVELPQLPVLHLVDLLELQIHFSRRLLFDGRAR